MSNTNQFIQFIKIKKIQGIRISKTNEDFELCKDCFKAKECNEKTQDCSEYIPLDVFLNDELMKNDWVDEIEVDDDDIFMKDYISGKIFAKLSLEKAKKTKENQIQCLACDKLIPFQEGDAKVFEGCTCGNKDINEFILSAKISHDNEEFILKLQELKYPLSHFPHLNNYRVNLLIKVILNYTDGDFHNSYAHNKDITSWFK